jgi:formylglycine-generating enzyme required for sulfatase activity
MSDVVRRTATGDAYVGLENPTQAQWDEWHRAMLAERARVLAEARFDGAIYDDASVAWSDTAFRQLFLFMYDAAFYDARARRYHTEEMIAEQCARFGRVDEVLLWHAYPRLGFDLRTQFDFYRQMPGGLAGLRADVCDVLHARGIRVIVDYNPWDAGSYDELAEIVSALDADGVMLDTMTDVPDALRAAVHGKKRGVVFAPELRPSVADLSFARRSWAQWFDVGDDATPSIYRSRWLVPRHRQLAIARWDKSRKKDIVYSFFNGAGLVLWENIFGSMNPYSREDRRLIAETGAVLERYGDLFAHGEWQPLIPTGAAGLDANRFFDETTGREIVTFRNRTDEARDFVVPARERGNGLAWFALWGASRGVDVGAKVTTEAKGTQALVLDHPRHATAAIAHFEEASRRASTSTPTSTSTPASPGQGSAPTPHFSPPSASLPEVRTPMVLIPGGAFRMRVRHERRECGCYPDGADDGVVWGWFYKDEIAHEMHVTLAPFAIRATAVTNAEYVAFVHASGYRPADQARFLAHLARESDGTLTRALSADAGASPVTFVSLDDARAFASFYGERLPTEAEWQWAAEGAGRSRRFPWGDEERSFPNALRAAHDASSATPEGVMGLCGNAWELTESERTDGHTRFVMLRGGSYLPPRQSEWLVERGARPNDSHAKYILLADGLDRSEAISFRTVRDR